MQSLSQFLDGSVQADFEVHEGVGSPEFPMQLLSCDQLARVFKQQDQNLKRLVVKFDLHAFLAQLARTQINLKNAEPNTVWE
jgi:hypothetical protein